MISYFSYTFHHISLQSPALWDREATKGHDDRGVILCRIVLWWKWRLVKTRMRIGSSQRITIISINMWMKRMIREILGRDKLGQSIKEDWSASHIEEESFSSDKRVGLFVCGLQPARVLLWTSTNWPSCQARVTSVNSVSALLFWPKPLIIWVQEMGESESENTSRPHHHINIAWSIHLQPLRCPE